MIRKIMQMSCKKRRANQKGKYFEETVLLDTGHATILAARDGSFYKSISSTEVKDALQNPYIATHQYKYIVVRTHRKKTFTDTFSKITQEQRICQ